MTEARGSLTRPGRKKTTWNRFEVIVIENNSTDPATFAYYEKARQRYDGLKAVSYTHLAVWGILPAL